MSDDTTHRKQAAEAVDAWARRIRQGTGHVDPPPGRGGAQGIYGAWRGTAEGDARLATLAAVADASGTAPWETGRRRGGWRGGAWLAIAASVALMVVVGWRVWDAQRPPAQLALHVGFNDFGDGTRGGEPLPAGGAARIFMTLPEEGVFAILLLDAELQLSCEQSNVGVPAGRIEIPWQLPEGLSGPIEETLVVVVCGDEWPAFETVVRNLATTLSGSRVERRDEILDVLGRGDACVVEAVTYEVAP